MCTRNQKHCQKLALPTSSTLLVDFPNQREKMGKRPFQKNNPAFCPTSQTNWENAPLLKLDFLKIEL